MLREAGAREVHFRVSSPPYRWPCFYGMDTGRRGELLAADLSVGEIREYLDVDSLAYLELDRVRARHRRAARVVLHRVPLGRVPGAGRADRQRLEAAARGAGARPHRVERVAHAVTDADPPEPTAGRRRAHLRATPASTSAPARRPSSSSRSTSARRSGPRSSATSAASAGSSRSASSRTGTRCSSLSTDGVGTKSIIARLMARYDTIGLDVVAMSVDDIAVQGAEPLLVPRLPLGGQGRPRDGRRDRERGRRGVPPGRLRAERRRDLRAPRPDGAGRVRPRRLRGRRRRAGRDPAARRARRATRSSGFASPGLRCNGYSLARRALLDRRGRALDEPAWDGAHHSLGDELLDPERDLRAGDGRAAPPRRGARVRAHHRRRDPRQPRARRSPTTATASCTAGTWDEPRIFAEIQAAGDVSDDEMEQVFNLGLGMLAVVPARRGVPRARRGARRRVRRRGSSARSSTATAARTSTAREPDASGARGRLLEPAGREPRALAARRADARSASSAATGSRASTAGAAARTPRS